jgi:Coenzyme PQQ synthesis protein D (PqqD)
MYHLAPDISMAETEYGIALLNQASGQYWNLNPTGAIVLRAALESEDLGPAVDRLASEFTVRREDAERDVHDMVVQLLDGRILVAGEPA